ncbi:hypothetical protein PA0597 [Candidatus Phytoplasma australiense]|uniref:Uncharacterized protein n=1 Tax=Phytoplasma australiense TaxID=59748 RepID=B1VAF8_PHYAS|nr:hypothetical protein PA0597 [Candidatus Phytoplasma australiense]
MIYEGYEMFKEFFIFLVSFVLGVILGTYLYCKGSEFDKFFNLRKDNELNFLEKTSKQWHKQFDENYNKFKNWLDANNKNNKN